MKTSSPSTGATSKNLPKTLFLPCDSKGGVGKSTSTAFIADALATLGYRVGMGDADTHNLTMSQFFPDIPRFNIESHDDINKLLHAVATGDQDLFLCDLPGTFSLKLAGYLQKLGKGTFQKANVRLVFGLAINETQDSVNGVVDWIHAVAGMSEFIIVASGDKSEGDTVDLNNLMGGDELKNICQNRVLHIPKIPVDRFQEFKRVKKPLSKLVPSNDEDAKTLNFWNSRNWIGYQYEVVSNVAKHAEFLTGKPIPNDSFLANEDKPSNPDKPSQMTEMLSSFKKKIAPLKDPKK